MKEMLVMSVWSRASHVLHVFLEAPVLCTCLGVLGFGYAGKSPALTKLAGPASAPVTTDLPSPGCGSGAASWLPAF
jgi:hypothetical protein